MSIESSCISLLHRDKVHDIHTANKLCLHMFSHQNIHSIKHPLYSFHCLLPDPPSITASPASTIQILNTATFNLFCSADGQPYPSIVWLRNLSNGSHAVFKTSSIAENGRSFTLSYNSTSASEVMSTFSVDTSLVVDTGSYSCIATNRLGSSSSNISTVSIYGAWIVLSHN